MVPNHNRTTGTEPQSQRAGNDFCPGDRRVSVVKPVEKNVGGLDRIGRIVIGVLLLIAGIAALGGVWELSLVAGIVVLLIGVLLLATGASQKCPVNQAAGIDTTERR